MLVIADVFRMIQPQMVWRLWDFLILVIQVQQRLVYHVRVSSGG
jgi:hypothetical protein